MIVEAKSNSTVELNHYSNRNTCCIGTLVVRRQRQKAKACYSIKGVKKEKTRRSRLSVAREEEKEERKKESRRKERKKHENSRMFCGYHDSGCHNEQYRTNGIIGKTKES